MAPLPPEASEFDRSVLESDRRARLFGYSIIATVFAGFLIWATVAPLESAALASGTVQVKGNRKLVQHYEGGIVHEIFVSSGDFVDEGQPLIQLDVTLVSAEQRIIEGKVWSHRALVDRLIAERNDEPEILFQGWLLEQTDERAKTAVIGERELFLARRADRLGEISLLNQKETQLERQITGFLAVIGAKNKVAESLREERTELEFLLVEGYADKQRIRQLDRSLAQNLGELADLNLKVEAARVALEEIRLTILQLNKRFKTQVVNALALAQSELFDMQQRLTALDDRLDRMSVKSPASGYVLGLKPNARGEVIAPGEELMAIVPDVDKFIIDAKIRPQDVDRIRVGQEAEVRFAVFKDAYSLTGSLIKVSADSLIDDVSGEPYYEAKVDLFEQDLALLGEAKLVPGMPATVLIKTGDRSFLGYLVSPLARMFEKSLIER